MSRPSTEHFLAILENNERRWAEHEREIERHAAEHQAAIAKIGELKRKTAPRDPFLHELDMVLKPVRSPRKRRTYENI